MFWTPRTPGNDPLSRIYIDFHGRKHVAVCVDCLSPLGTGDDCRKDLSGHLPLSAVNAAAAAHLDTCTSDPGIGDPSSLRLLHVAVFRAPESAGSEQPAAPYALGLWSSGTDLTEAPPWDKIIDPADMEVMFRYPYSLMNRNATIPCTDPATAAATALHAASHTYGFTPGVHTTATVTDLTDRELPRRL